MGMFAQVALLTAMVGEKPEGARGESIMQLAEPSSWWGKGNCQDENGLVSEKIIMVPSPDLTVLF